VRGDSREVGKGGAGKSSGQTGRIGQADGTIWGLIRPYGLIRPIAPPRTCGAVGRVGATERDREGEVEWSGRDHAPAG